MLNRIFWSKKAHRILTALFVLSFFAYGNIFNMALNGNYTDADTVGAGLGILVACYYDMLYIGYFIVRFIWRIFNKPDVNQYEIDKRTMPRDKFMDKYGVYRPGMFDL